MCRLFIGANPELWQSVTRSLRIDGVVTSVRLENFFWWALEDIAARDDLTVNRLIGKLYNESRNEGHDLDNFASFLRVCCGRYLSLQLNGLVPMDQSTAISTLDADAILASEEKNYRQRPSSWEKSRNSDHAAHRAA
ncbi:MULTISPECIES: ribbon-helix-helix domain-containing protein [Brucella/Ochrobactrum group]|jgi:predicted DNA-binding ribbon-helix-helix protein|uniref:Ribbon-helix-helix domain-containing protein n=1 Tax=Brucella pseudintermedia TaxID=370111 RepID=A0ABY5UC24_9HYPH|nr:MULTISPECIES: ribbon-helix-helix domain-containing protein [Brucella/Ochrobactrum group]KAB2683896.1 ribbon-helix-helix domain-containing protein [Brucella pseudintermedia]MCO7727743.1 ribbon-helix-helix domain-containing protein [Brucella intermedia]NKE77077.1 ribbon-helix-helix domain-containing protein [Ochrobactrum sp. MC-1LL]TWH03811.1 putative DNA-binding ribbon-helix-helix protein [Ochrobactrum sp. J50]UWL60875.1 ribbon-helix-helix domain-containing protein [Brucella pseudintermedia]